MFSKIKMFAICGITASLLVASMGGMVFADPAPNIVLTGGDRVIDPLLIADFTPVTLDGTTQTTTAVVTPNNLIDATGSGDGWHVSLTASQFENASFETLSLSSLDLGTVSIAIAAGGAGSSPAEDITTTSTGKIDSVSGVNILSAAEEVAGVTPGEGMGSYTVTIDPITLTLLPKEAKAGTFSSTVIETLALGPVV